jgi:hypothetical protein
MEDLDHPPGDSPHTVIREEPHFDGFDFSTSTCFKRQRPGTICDDSGGVWTLDGLSCVPASGGTSNVVKTGNKVGGGSSATTPPPGPGKVVTMGPAKPDCFLGSNAYPPTGIQVAACYSGTGTSAPWPLLREMRLVAAVLEEVHARATSVQCSVFSVFSIASPEAASVFVGTQSASAWVQRAFLKPSIHTTAAAASRASGWVTAGATAGDISCRLAGINR